MQGPSIASAARHISPTSPLRLVSSPGGLLSAGSLSSSASRRSVRRGSHAVGRYVVWSSDTAALQVTQRQHDREHLLLQQGHHVTPAGPTALPSSVCVLWHGEWSWPVDEAAFVLQRRLQGSRPGRSHGCSICAERRRRPASAQVPMLPTALVMDLLASPAYQRSWLLRLSARMSHCPSQTLLSVELRTLLFVQAGCWRRRLWHGGGKRPRPRHDSRQRPRRPNAAGDSVSDPGHGCARGSPLDSAAQPVCLAAAPRDARHRASARLCMWSLILQMVTTTVHVLFEIRFSVSCSGFSRPSSIQSLRVSCAVMRSKEPRLSGSGRSSLYRLLSGGPIRN